MLLVDATTAEHATGIRVVIDGFLQAAAEAPWRDDLIVVAGPNAGVPSGLRTIRLPLASSKPGRLAYQRALLPAHLALLARRDLHVDRVLLLDAYLPILRPQRGVLYTALIHDVLALTHPEYWSRSQLLVKRLAYRTIRHGHPALITSSEHNVCEIDRALGLPARAARFGCGQLTDADADAELKRPPVERESHLLYVGAIQPRKDIATLVDAFAQAAPYLPEDTRLLLVGSAHGDYEGLIRQRIAASGVAQRIELLGPRPRAETLDLMRTARAIVFPSIAEGFGLPMLEALALGTPVIASDLPEFHDWARDMATYAAPGDSQAFAGAIRTVCSGHHPSPIQGKALASTYRWHDFADALVTGK